MIILIIILTLIVILLTGGLIFFISKYTKNLKIKTIEGIQDILDSKGFYPKKILTVNSKITIALNHDSTMIAIIKNFNPDIPTMYEFELFATSFITSIEQKSCLLNIHYIKNGLHKTLHINTVNKEIKNFFYFVLKEMCTRKIRQKYPEYNFTITTASDWSCSYVWAYSPKGNVLAYFKSMDNPQIFKINLLKEHFTINTKYNYFEAPILGEMQQLLMYEKDFIYKLFNSVFESIKEKTSIISDEKIYYDILKDIVYISDGTSTLQSIRLDKTEEVFYFDNRVSFMPYGSEKTINFFATDKDFVKEFEEFIISYNLRKIAVDFDYKTDKLINTTPNTKFIIDKTRSRLVYCASLNSLSKFSYINIAFDNIEDVKAEINNLSNFVRIYTKNNEIIDVSCKKHEVAQYILAQIKNIIDEA